MADLFGGQHGAVLRRLGADLTGLNVAEGLGAGHGLGLDLGVGHLVGLALLDQVGFAPLDGDLLSLVHVDSTALLP